MSKHQAYEMFYSVTWNTEERDFSKNVTDFTAREELWLAKLGSWTEALSIYEEKLNHNPEDFEAIVGCMQCLVANGEWQKVIELADENWSTMIDQELLVGHETLPQKLQRKAVRMGAQAAWRLGQWGELDKFASHLLVGAEAQNYSSVSLMAPSESSRPAIDFDGSFFSAILHIHRKEWTSAANAIDAARREMDGRLTALMAESYSRAYPSMVTAQILAGTFI
jgi:serine/threonine-protein kinase mTOR